MGLFSDITGFVTKPISRALGPVGSILFAPAVVTTTLTSNLLDKVIEGVVSPHGSHPTFRASHPTPVIPPRQPAAPYNSYAYPPSYGFQPSPNLTPTYPGTFADIPPTYYGGSPWAYSTISPAYSPMPSPMYSEGAPTSRTWEDLLNLAPLVAGFL